MTKIKALECTLAEYKNGTHEIGACASCIAADFNCGNCVWVEIEGQSCINWITKLGGGNLFFDDSKIAKIRIKEIPKWIKYLKKEASWTSRI